MASDVDSRLMVIIRCTQKLLKRIGMPVRSPDRPTNNPDRPTYGPVEPTSTTRLGDWFATPVQVGRQHFILLIAERTRVPVVVRGKNAKHLGAHLVEALPDVLHTMGVPDAAVSRETDEMRQCVYAPTNDRSIVGTLNEFAYFLARHVEEEPEAELVRLALELSGTPVSVLETSIRRLTLRAFEGDASPDKIRTYRLKVTLARSEPAIWRRFEVPADVPLDQLHLVLQIVMGWTNSHLHAFERDGVIYGTYDSESEIACVDERLRRLSDVLTEPGASLDYEYDFGDGWEHRIVLEAIVDGGTRVARVLDGQRACPPDDTGGIHRYQDLLKVIANPTHPDHQELMDWFGAGFDPDTYDFTKVNARLGTLKLRPRSSGPVNQSGLLH